MKNVSQLYKDIKATKGSFYEARIVQGNKTYGLDKIVSLKIFPSLVGDANGIAIGNACSAQCELKLLESSANWERMALFDVEVRITKEDKSQSSEWLKLGTFYTDERSEDTYGQLTIIAYDGMLLTEQYWTDKIPEESLPSSFPITAKAFCDMLEGQNLIQVDSRTTLDDSVAFIGLDTTSTIRDKLKDIASAHGSNWVVTSEGKLRLVPFANMVDGSAAIAGIAIVGISVVGDGQIEIDSNIDYAFLGMDVKTFDSSPALPQVTSAVLETEAGNHDTAGNANGYRLKGNCQFSATGVASLALNNAQGYVYKPFSATEALLDPCAEVGDLVVINGRSYQMMNIEWNICQKPTATINAPYEQEVDHEYTIISPNAKAYRKSLQATDEKLEAYPTTVEMQSAITQTEQSITAAVSATYVTLTNYNETIANLQEQIDGQINTYSGGTVPTLSNYPAEDWTTAEERRQHVGALYLVTSDEGAEEAGQYYRFEQNGDNFAWVLVEDSALATALARAAEAQAAAEQAIADAATAQAAADAAQGTADEASALALSESAKAKAEALAEAAVDATNKANQALADAQAYSNAQLDVFVKTQFAELKDQVDGKIETYYQANDPSLGFGEEDHTGDLWYDTTNQLYYRWNGTAWESVTANPPNAVFDRIDGKARVFVSEPVPPYAVGDLWVQGATGDILKSTADRQEGTFVRADWVLASKYTDDSGLTQFITGEYAEMLASIKKQLDGKAETYYQADDPEHDASGHSRWDVVAGKAIVGIAIVGSSNEIHEGDMWYRTTDDTTWRWTYADNEWKWVQQSIPKAMFDVFDGKANIFITQPVPPYKTADLWVQGDTGDILRCKENVDKSSGDQFDANDWELASKYTDDTYAEGVASNLAQNYYTKTEVNAELQTTATAVTATVTKNVISSNLLPLPYEELRTGYTYRIGNLTLRIKDSGEIEASGSTNIATTKCLFGSNTNLKLPVGTYTFSAYQDNDSGNKIPIRIYAVDDEGSTLIAQTTEQKTFEWEDANKRFEAYLYAQAYRIYDCVIKPQLEVGSVSHGWQPPALSTKTQLSVESDAIRASVVSKTGGNNVQNSFAWSLTDSGHYWYANGSQDPVVEITASGLKVRGEVHATTGYIGSDSQGFEIGASYIRNGMTSYSDTEHNGVYIGTDGISLGGGNFKVDANGNITASSGTFTGNVYAENIQHGAVGGYLNGSAISSGSGWSGFSTSYLASGVNTSLGYANNYNSATINGTSTFPQFFKAGSITATGNLTANEYYVRVDEETQITLSGHYHRITENQQDGTVTIGEPYNDRNPPSFKIANTKAYKDAVLAATIASATYQTTGQSSYNTYDEGYDIDIPFASLYSLSNKLYGRIRVLNENNGLLKTMRVVMPDRYNEGAAAKSISAWAYPTDPVTEEVTTYDELYVTFSDNDHLTKSLPLVGGKTLYNYAEDNGKDEGAATATVSALSVQAVGTPTYSDEAEAWIAYASATATPRATPSSGTPTDYTPVTFTNRPIDVTAVYDAGRTSPRIATISMFGEQGDSSHKFNATITASASGTGISGGSGTYDISLLVDENSTSNVKMVVKHGNDVIAERSVTPEHPTPPTPQAYVSISGSSTDVSNKGTITATAFGDGLIGATGTYDIFLSLDASTHTAKVLDSSNNELATRSYPYPSGSRSITSNGTYDVENYSSVSVSVPTGYSRCTIYAGSSAEWGGWYYQEFYTETDSINVRSKSKIYW